MESRADLFNQQPCILIRNDMQSLEICSSFWKSLGMKVFQMDSQVHDKTFSDISHLPCWKEPFICIFRKRNTRGYSRNECKGFSPRLGKANKNLWDVFKR